MEQKEILKSCVQKGFLLDKEILEIICKLEDNIIKKFIEILWELKLNEKVITKSIFIDNLNKINEKINIKDIVGLVAISGGQVGNQSFKVLTNNKIIPKKIEVNDFIKHFRSRYEYLRDILQKKDLKNLKSIRRLTVERENIDIIVMVLNKKLTKNKNLILDVEDLTGRTKILVNASKGELYERCKNILPDDVVAFSASGNKEILFANNIIFPDSFLLERKKIDKEVFVAFSSDIHVGSKMFLEENFLNFIKWINGESGSEEDKIFAKKIEYLFLVGDNIDGIGVFPDQERLLNIPEVSLQYIKLAELLSLIRKDIKIIMCPGQHDAVWVGEPQPIIGREWASKLYELKNVVLVPNPSMVEVEGFKVLMYHGASFHGIIGEMNDIRLVYGHNSPTIVVKELLKRRHLAPSHGLCDYVPNETRDPMIIDNIPDIVATGDLHRSEISVYNNILLIASSCWESQTPFEEKIGNNPDPCKVPILNLKTREIKIMDFGEKNGN
jgi:DNA polymerase II small subunit